MSLRSLAEAIIEKFVIQNINEKLKEYHVQIDLVPNHDEVRILTDAGTIYVGLLLKDGNLTELKEIKKEMKNA